MRMGDGSTLETYRYVDRKIRRIDLLGKLYAARPVFHVCPGVQIYVAPTWDYGEPWVSTLRHIAKEGSVYVLGACMPMKVSDIPNNWNSKNNMNPQKNGLIRVTASLLIRKEKSSPVLE